MSWQSDLKRSNKIFMEKIWHIIAEKCGGGYIQPCEVMHDNTIAADLDLMAGVDIWQKTGDGVRGIASRVQFNCLKPYNTFTIRFARDSGTETEFSKRKQSIESGRFISPYLTVQAYMDSDNNLLSVGVARTIDIYNAIKNEPQIKRTTNASFIVVPFESVDGIYMWSCNHA